MHLTKEVHEEIINGRKGKFKGLETYLENAKNNVFEETRSEAIKWSKKARNYLDIFPESKTKVILQELTYFVVERIT